MSTPAPESTPRSFAALRVPAFRPFFAFSSLAMAADNIEHVITYWIIFTKFQSPILGGIAVITHWVPFLLFAFVSGALADRFDPRRLIQIGMAIFMFVSIAWAVIFLVGVAEVWHAVVLLTLHGIAGVLWQPAAQLLVHDLVGSQHLQSAVRLNATGRYLGLLVGPGLGAALMLLAGPAIGLFINAAIYLPMFIWLARTKSGARAPGAPKPKPLGTADIGIGLRAVAANRTIWLMVALAGAASFFLGGAYHAQMPGFAHDLGQDRADFRYGALLAADAAGALLAGLVLEGRGLLRSNPRTAIILAMLWCTALGSFALVNVYELALVLLFFAGFVELSFSAMAQTLVQIHAPPEIRGKVIGLFTMSALGLRAFSGVVVGLMGGVIGIHWSLFLGASSVMIVSVVLLLVAIRPRPAPSSA